MPRAGGIFSLVPGYFATDGTTIEVSQHNPVFEDVAQALTDSLPRDGSAPMTGNLAMGSKKITGLAAATLASDAVRFDQLPTFTPTTATLTAGTNAQGQGPITTDQVTITVAAANPSGATLPTAVAGKRVIIANRGANPVNIYPATGAAIGALATNAPVLLAVNQSVEFFARSATQWEGQISQPLDADLTAISALGGTGIAVRTAADTWAQRQIVSADGSITISNPAGAGGDIDLSTGDVFGTPIPTTSGTTVNLSTAVPASVRRVHVLLDAVSLTGTDGVGIRVGSGAFATSGYAAAGGTGSSWTNSTTHFPLNVSTAGAHTLTGVITLTHMGSNKWLLGANLYQAGGNWVSVAAGQVTLGGPLDRVQLFSAGANTFDAGQASIWWGVTP